MKSIIRIAHLLALAFLLQACGTTEWVKAGADNAAVQRDMEQCREVALRRGPPPVLPSGSADPRADSGGRVGGMNPSTGSNERYVAEQEEVRRCMLQRGYQLRRTS